MPSFETLAFELTWADAAGDSERSSQLTDFLASGSGSRSEPVETEILQYSVS